MVVAVVDMPCVLCHRHCRRRGDHRAHIPQQRGGAPGRAIPSGWGRLELINARWWWRRNEGRRTKVSHDVVDGSFKLCSPSQIAFDINACRVDNKIKN
jgi:hypothetical protein